MGRRVISAGVRDRRSDRHQSDRWSSPSCLRRPLETVSPPPGGKPIGLRRQRALDCATAPVAGNLGVRGVPVASPAPRVPPVPFARPKSRIAGCSIPRAPTLAPSPGTGVAWLSSSQRVSTSWDFVEPLVHQPATAPLLSALSISDGVWGERDTNVLVIAAVMTVRKPIPSSITSAARSCPETFRRNIVAVPDRRHCLDSPPQTRPDGREVVAVDDRHQDPRPERDRGRR